MKIPLPTARQQECYFPTDDYGAFRMLGVEDLPLISQTLNRKFVVVDGDEMKAYRLQPGVAKEELTIDGGLRHLRFNPIESGVLVFNGHFYYIETSWRHDAKKERPRGLEAELVLALLRCRGKRHVAFW